MKPEFGYHDAQLLTLGMPRVQQTGAIVKPEFGYHDAHLLTLGDPQSAAQKGDREARVRLS